MRSRSRRLPAAEARKAKPPSPRGPGGGVAFERADVIYVNAGAPRPADAMARPPEGRGKADPAVDGGCISEPRCAAGSRIPDRAARPGIFGAPDLWGRDLSL